MKYYIEAIKNYAVFRGRSTRKEYWLFMLFYFIIYMAISIISGLLGDIDEVFPLAYALFMLLPMLSISVRRLHDTGRSGWCYLLSIIPFVGIVYWLIVFTQDSAIGLNEYGPDPKNRSGINIDFVKCPSCRAYQDKEAITCLNCGYNLGFYQAHEGEVIDVVVEEIGSIDEDIIDLKETDIVK